MTIKSKLIANILVTLAIIAFISMASFSSLSFLKDKLSYIAEKSTPFQMGTVEFQRELQSCITNLVKTSAARNMAEYTNFRAEVGASLENAGKAEKQLERLGNGQQLETVSELSRVSDGLLAATESRIKSDSAAREAQTKLSQQLKETSVRLKELEAHVRNLQASHAASFAKALESNTRFSSRLRALEELRNQIKELHSVANTVHNATTPTSFLIARGKTKTALARIAGNTRHEVASPDLETLNDDVSEFLQLHSNALFKKDSESLKWEKESFQDLSESLNRINLALNQEIELAASKLSIETSRQAFIFAQSNNANDILVNNSELMALAHTVSGLITRLFTLESTAELDTYTSEIRSLFIKVHERSVNLENALTIMGAKSDLQTMHIAHSSLETIRSQLFSAGGIITTLSTKLEAIKQADQATDILHNMVASQSTKGKQSVSAAQKEQEKSITDVNSMVKQSISKIAAVDAAAIIIGLFFGGWIYRTVVRPLRRVLNAITRQRDRASETAGIAIAIASGDLSREVEIGEAIQLDQSEMSNDEMRMVLNGIVGMSNAQVTLDHAFAGMTVSIRNNMDQEAKRDHLKSGLYELNNILRGEQGVTQLAERVLAYIAEFLDAGVGVMYHYNDTEEMLQTIACYAMPKTDKCLRLGEGLPGQAALERKTLTFNSVPPGYLPISSALGKADPLNIIILPIMHNDSLNGVLELGSFRLFGEDDFDFLKPALEGVAIALNVNRSRQLVNTLLEQSQQQSEELRSQQEELQQTNEELAERLQIIADQRHARKDIV